MAARAVEALASGHEVAVILLDLDEFKHLKGTFTFDGRLWDDSDVPALARMVEKVHEHGSLAGIELGHTGVQAENSESRLPSAAPSQLASAVPAYLSAGADLKDEPRYDPVTGRRLTPASDTAMVLNAVTIVVTRFTLLPRSPVGDTPHGWRALRECQLALAAHLSEPCVWLTVARGA